MNPMANKTYLLCTVLALAGCMTGNGDKGEGAAPSEQGLPLLLSDAPGAGNLPPALILPEEKRARLADVEPATVAETSSILASSRRFVLNLFEDTRFIAEVENARTPEPGRFTLTGRLAGIEGSFFILASHMGAVSATVYHPVRGYFEIKPEGGYRGKVSELDPDLIPRLKHGALRPDSSGLPHHVIPDEPVPHLPKSSAIPVLDILIVYTAAAETGAGGESAMRSRIDKAVAEVNTAFLNGNINARLNLIHAARINYAESGNMSTDLIRLRGKTDGYMDDVHALRETYKADYVSLVVEKAGGYAGIGYVMTYLSTSFRTYAFTVIGRQYTGSYNVLAHELGHNLGCAHDRQNSGSPGIYPYSYGYRFTASGRTYRTIMAYYPGTPLPYFSNPNLTYLGVKMGIPDGQANSADNARTINATAPIGATFYAGTPPLPKAGELFP